MDLFTAVAERHSYRGPFLDRPVPRADLEKIVRAGTLAPSGCNAQTTTFVMVDDPSLLREIYGILERPAVPPALIVCVAHQVATFQDMHFELEDCSAAVQNMLLAVTALGYATVWIDGQLRIDGKGEKIGALLGVPEGRRVQVILPVGVPAETAKPPKKLPFEQRAWFNQYGG